MRKSRSRLICSLLLHLALCDDVPPCEGFAPTHPTGFFSILDKGVCGSSYVLANPPNLACQPDCTCHQVLVDVKVTTSCMADQDPSTITKFTTTTPVTQVTMTETQGADTVTSTTFSTTSVTQWSTVYSTLAASTTTSVLLQARDSPVCGAISTSYITIDGCTYSVGNLGACSVCDKLTDALYEWGLHDFSTKTVLPDPKTTTVVKSADTSTKFVTETVKSTITEWSTVGSTATQLLTTTIWVSGPLIVITSTSHTYTPESSTTTSAVVTSDNGESPLSTVTLTSTENGLPQSTSVVNSASGTVIEGLTTSSTSELPGEVTTSSSESSDDGSSGMHLQLEWLGALFALFLLVLCAANV